MVSNDSVQIESDEGRDHGDEVDEDHSDKVDDEDDAELSMRNGANEGKGRGRGQGRGRGRGRGRGKAYRLPLRRTSTRLSLPVGSTKEEEDMLRAAMKASLLELQPPAGFDQLPHSDGLDAAVAKRRRSGSTDTDGTRDAERGTNQSQQQVRVRLPAVSLHMPVGGAFAGPEGVSTKTLGAAMQVLASDLEGIDEAQGVATRPDERFLGSVDPWSS